MNEIQEIVIHKNNLAQGKFEDFELRELKLFLTLISNLGRQSESFLADAKFIKSYIGMDKKSYSEFETIIRRLQKRVIEIRENENRYETYSVFSVLRFDSKEKTVNVKFNSDFIPFIHDLKSNYCKYSLENIKNLKSKYAILLYMRCQAEAFKTKFTISIDEMRVLFAGKYRKNNIDIKILNPALEEINNLTDLSVELSKEYCGREVVGYTFRIKKVFNISEELELAITQAKKNIFISRSGVINKDTIGILFNEFSEEELIEGLKESYKAIKKDFSTLSYLRAVIRTVLAKEDKTTEDIEEAEIVTKEEVKEKIEIEGIEITRGKIATKLIKEYRGPDAMKVMNRLSNLETIEEIIEFCKTQKIEI